MVLVVNFPKCFKKKFLGLLFLYIFDLVHGVEAIHVLC